MSNSSAIKLGLLLIIAGALQTSWLARIVFWGVHFDLPLLLTVSVALLFGWRAGAVFGLAAGYVTGVVIAKNIGSTMLSRIFCGAAIGLSDRNFGRDNIFAPPILAALGTLLSDVVLLIMAPTDFPLSWWFAHTPLKMLVHAIFIWPLHYTVKRLVNPSSRNMFFS